ncbi:MAG: ABC transporter permease [Pyrinomonadaceae bacterium]|nr:ABC transporter permease [Pyrinomonadaceae bacterium]
MRIEKFELQSKAMPYELKLAWRYFRSSRKNLVRFTSAVAIIGIAAGVASLIIAQAVAQGFRDEIRDKVLGNTAHILVSDNGSPGISNWSIIKKKISEIDGVEQVEPTSFESAVISTEKKTSHAIIRVKDWKKQGNPKTRKDDEVAVRVAIGRELAGELGLSIGDESAILTFGGDDAPRNSKVVVGEVFETGLFEYDSSWIYVSKDDYLRLTNISSFSPSVYSVSVEDIYKTEKISGELRSVLGGNFKVLDWQQANKPLFTALSLERKVALAMIGLIIFIAALNITSTIALLVNERKYDIGVLKTFGASTRNIVLIFFFEGMILSGLGIFSGVVLGLLACIAGNYLRLLSLSKEVYSLNYVPFNTSLFAVFQIAIIALFICLAAIVYPAIRAGKIKPIENLKTQ